MFRKVSYLWDSPIVWTPPGMDMILGYHSLYLARWATSSFCRDGTSTAAGWQHIHDLSISNQQTIACIQELFKIMQSLWINNDNKMIMFQECTYSEILLIFLLLLFLQGELHMPEQFLYIGNGTVTEFSWTSTISIISYRWISFQNLNANHIKSIRSNIRLSIFSISLSACLSTCVCACMYVCMWVVIWTDREAFPKKAKTTDNRLLRLQSWKQ